MNIVNLKRTGFYLFVATILSATNYSSLSDATEKSDEKKVADIKPAANNNAEKKLHDTSKFKVTAPPKELKLDPFYKKHINVDGFPVIGSEKVQDAALVEAAYLIHLMLKDRPDILKAMVRNQSRYVVMAVNEFTTDVPEHSDLKPKDYYDRRARGLGASPRRPATSCGEENLLGIKSDPYHEENILIHEFAHAVHHMGLNFIDAGFDKKLKSVYASAMKAGLWKTKYAATNRAEYWAEGVQSYFGTNRKPDHDHNHVDTRAELKKYDPALHDLVAKVFVNAKWTYIHPTKRKDQAHWKNYDFAKAPKFVWPKKLEQIGRDIRNKARNRK